MDTAVFLFGNRTSTSALYYAMVKCVKEWQRIYSLQIFCSYRMDPMNGVLSGSGVADFSMIKYRYPEKKQTAMWACSLSVIYALTSDGSLLLPATYFRL